MHSAPWDHRGGSGLGRRARTFAAVLSALCSQVPGMMVLLPLPQGMAGPDGAKGGKNSMPVSAQA